MLPEINVCVCTSNLVNVFGKKVTETYDSVSLYTIISLCDFFSKHLLNLM